MPAQAFFPKLHLVACDIILLLDVSFLRLLFSYALFQPLLVSSFLLQLTSALPFLLPTFLDALTPLFPLQSLLAALFQLFPVRV